MALMTDVTDLSIGDVDSEIDIAERSATDFPHDTVLSADDELGASTRQCRRHRRGYVTKSPCGKNADKILYVAWVEMTPAKRNTELKPRLVGL
jgi:hypothetical protein